MNVKDFFGEANYRIGDHFYRMNQTSKSRSQYLLAWVGNHTVNMFGLEDGIKILNSEQPVEDTQNITHLELKKFFEFWPDLKLVNERQSLKGLKVGMKFKNASSKRIWLLATVDQNSVQLISLDGESHWGGPVKINNYDNINMDEFMRIIHGDRYNLNNWELVSD